MIIAYGPGDVRAVCVDGRPINATLSTFEFNVDAEIVNPTGLGEDWGRAVPLGVKKGTATQDGWLPLEVRDLFSVRDQLDASELLVLPTGGAGHEAVRMTGRCKGSIKYGMPRDNLITATIDWGISGEVQRGLEVVGHVERVNPLDIFGDRAAAILTGGAVSRNVLASARVGTASTEGGTLYFALGAVTFARNYDRVRVTAADAADLSGAFNAGRAFAAAGVGSVPLTGAVPGDMFLAVQFVPAFTMRTVSAANANAATLDLQKVVATTDSYLVGDKFTLAGDTTVYEITTRAAVGQNFRYGITPNLAANVGAAVAATPDTDGNEATDAIVALKRGS